MTLSATERCKYFVIIVNMKSQQSGKMINANISPHLNEISVKRNLELIYSSKS